jgi:hypothetical protein
MSKQNSPAEMANAATHFDTEAEDGGTDGETILVVKRCHAQPDAQGHSEAPA